jgi:4-amino-4-deoxy-L-arabinose transferase-like glycosyltransferase
MALVLIVALAVRAAFAFRVPMFVTKDSLEYIEPALNLLAGQPFDLPQRRTPVYPLFLAGAMALVGPDLQGIAFVQHLLGAATAVFAFVIGRACFGTAAGTMSGLLTALASPLLIYEHYLITESVFTFLLVGALTLLVTGLARRSNWLMAAGGITLGLASLTRPVGQIVLLSVPIGIWWAYRRWRPTLTASALVVGCFALVIVPWAIRNQLVYGTAMAASTGRFLISRSVKHERNFVFYDPNVGALPGEHPNRTRARQIAQEVTNKRPEPGQVFQRIRDELRLTEAQTDNMLKDIALEAIMRDPWLWVQGTFEMFYELIEGAPKEENVSWHLEVHPQPRVANQWGRLAPLLGPTLTPTQQNEIARAEWIARIFRPTAWWRVITLLFVVGAIVAVVRPTGRQALLPALVAFCLIAFSAALVGAVERYRFPADPLVYAVAAGGLLSVLGLIARGVARFGGGQRSAAAGTDLETTGVRV